MFSFTNDWFILNKVKRSFDKLKNTIDLNYELTMIEIGSFEGQSTCYFINNYLSHPKSKIYCIDTWCGSIEHSQEEKKGLYERFINNIRNTDKYEKVIIKKGFSFDKLCELCIENVKADIIYIDGSHRACDVLADAILSWNCCKIGGYIIFDDYLLQQDNIINMPKIAIDSFINIYSDKIRMLRGWTSYQFIIQKVKE